MEKKIVRSGAQNDSRQTLVDQPGSYRSARKAMNQNCPLIQGVHAVELEYFFLAFLVDTLRGMHNERSVTRTFREFGRQLRIKRERVSPPKVRDNPHWKSGVQQIRADGVVMAHGRHPAEQVADTSPP
jgi:hypothetical protein